jgi:multimeric flavodoxin WrbA
MREKTMKVVAINGSPRMDKGNTALILTPFLEGMREAGADVELYYTKKLKINPCQGEFHCAVKTPGECFQRDDMQMLHPKLCEADVWVFATPVYVSGMTGPTKNLIDRMLIPLGEAFLELRDGHCRHRMREGIKHGQVVLVSNCAYWEMDNFDLLLAHMRAFCEHAERAFAGALLRPHGEVLRPMMESGAPIGDVFSAAKEAGRQLVKDGRMSPKTLSVVCRELLPLEMYVRKTG